MISLLNNQDNDMFHEDFYNECINRKIDKKTICKNIIIPQMITIRIINQQVLTRFPMRSKTNQM